MKTSDFDYELPQELIAQTPIEPRDHSRLLVYDRADRSVRHLHFYDLPQLLRAVGRDPGSAQLAANLGLSAGQHLQNVHHGLPSCTLRSR